MFKRGMDSHGQLSVEYLLLLVVIFAVFGFMITYLIGPSIDASNDISDVSAASNALNTIANAANVVYANGPGSQRTIQVYIPANMTITSNGTTISSNILLSDGSIKTESVSLNGPIYAGSYNLTKGNKKAIIMWSANKITTKINWWIG